VKVGDLVKVKAELRENCLPNHAGTNSECICWFCWSNSSGVGVILDHGLSDIDEDGLEYNTLDWIILFDAGEYSMFTKEIEVVSEGR
jgi:hypothetical protein